MTDEEKKAIEIVKEIKDIRGMRQDVDGENEDLCALDTIINLIEKQSKEIEEAEQKERKAYIKGTNDADELCNKKWEDKIKAKIEEIDRKIEFEQNEKVIIYLHKQKRVLQSLLEKE